MMKTEVKRNECVYCRVVHKKGLFCPTERKARNENYHLRYCMVQEERPDFRGLTLPEMRWIASELATYKKATVSPCEVLYILKLGGKEKKNARRAFNKKIVIMNGINAYKSYSCLKPMEKGRDNTNI